MSVIVKFNKRYGTFQEGEIAGLPGDTAKRLLASGQVELFENGLPRPARPDEIDQPEPMVIVEFIAHYGRFQKGEIAGVSRSLAAELIVQDEQGRAYARVHGDGVPDRPARSEADDSSHPGSDVEDGEISEDAASVAADGVFDADDKVAMQAAEPKLQDKIFDSLAASDILSAAGVLNAGIAGLSVEVKGVGKPTAEKLVSAATKTLQDKGVAV